MQPRGPVRLRNKRSSSHYSQAIITDRIIAVVNPDRSKAGSFLALPPTFTYPGEHSPSSNRVCVLLRGIAGVPCSWVGQLRSQEREPKVPGIISFWDRWEAVLGRDMQSIFFPPGSCQDRKAAVPTDWLVSLDL